MSSKVKTASEESCISLFGWAGYIRDRAVVEGKLWL